MNIADETKLNCLVKNEPIVFEIDIEEEKNFIIEDAKKRHENFKKSKYNQHKDNEWKEQIEKDLEVLNRLGIDIKHSNIPLYPARNKLLTRVQLEELGLNNKDILEVLNTIFEENDSKLGKKDELMLKKVNAFIEQQKELIKQNKEERTRRIRNDNKAMHYDAMQKYYFEREKQIEVEHKKEIKALETKIEILQSELNYYKDKEEFNKK